jgi:hypothetical protein
MAGRRMDSVATGALSKPFAWPADSCKEKRPCRHDSPETDFAKLCDENCDVLHFLIPRV